MSSQISLPPRRLRRQALPGGDGTSKKAKAPIVERGDKLMKRIPRRTVHLKTLCLLTRGDLYYHIRDCMTELLDSHNCMWFHDLPVVEFDTTPDLRPPELAGRETFIDRVYNVYHCNPLFLNQWMAVFGEENATTNRLR